METGRQMRQAGPMASPGISTLHPQELCSMMWHTKGSTMLSSASAYPQKILFFFEETATSQETVGIDR